MQLIRNTNLQRRDYSATKVVFILFTLILGNSYLYAQNKTIEKPKKQTRMGKTESNATPKSLADISAQSSIITNNPISNSGATLKSNANAKTNSNTPSQQTNVAHPTTNYNGSESANVYKRKYDYKGFEMDRDLLIKNLEHNVQDYMRYKNWDNSKRNSFYSTYKKYLSAIEEGRISTDYSGSLVDAAGILGNGSPIWYDKNGNAYSQEEYEQLSKKKQKSCLDFYPNRAVASYINIIASGLYERTK